MVQSIVHQLITDPLKQIRERAKSNKRCIVFPEGTEPRTLLAAKKITEDGMADVILLGDKSQIAKAARENSVDLDSVDAINPESSEQLDRFVAEFVKLRKKKGISLREAQQTMMNPLYFGAMLVRKGIADASVAGAVNTTGDVIRAALQVIGLKKGIKSLSSCFLMVIPEYRGEKNKVFLYADCGVIPIPDSQQLADIATATAGTFQSLFNSEPNVAFLSFSTKGSARHVDVDKVIEAVKIFRKKHPELKADGELQVDAAIVPEIAVRKTPHSEVAGKANILIFPDLDAGNIAYKLTERLANARAVGPILQGLAKPATDLSRGCSVDDIVDAAAIACVMAL